MNYNLEDLYRKLVNKHRGMIQTYLSKYNLYIGQHRILFAIEETPGMTQTELGKEVKVSKESLSVSIKRLEQSGLVERTQDQGDRRFLRLHLTEEGGRVTRACRTGFDEINHTMFNQLTHEERELLRSLFIKMIDELEKRDTE